MPDDKEKTTQDESANNENENESEQQVETWEQHLEGMAEETRTLYDGHIGGLTSALAAERKQNKSLAKQMREASEKLKEGDDLKAQLEAMAGALEQATQRADFYKEAATHGVANNNLALLAAQDAGVIDKKGRVNWDALETEYPELFRKAATATINAGSGRQNVADSQNFGDMIRSAVRRQ